MNTYWNGERCEAKRVVVRVGTVLEPTWWCAGMEGTERKAVRVRYQGETFFIDDEDGFGWRKVTVERGGPHAAHASLPGDSVIISEERKE